MLRSSVKPVDSLVCSVSANKNSSSLYARSCFGFMGIFFSEQIPYICSVHPCPERDDKKTPDGRGGILLWTALHMQAASSFSAFAGAVFVHGGLFRRDSCLNEWCVQCHGMGERHRRQRNQDFLGGG